VPVQFHGGAVGGSESGLPWLGVQAYPGGLLVRMWDAAEAAISTSEIERLSADETQCSGRGWRLRVEHRSPDIASPLLLYVLPDGPLARAMEGSSGLACGGQQPRVT
jgi:hypothetical protein